MKVTVALAESSRLVRASLRLLLTADPGIEVVGEAADGYEAVALVERHRPHVLIVDLMLPGMSGLGVTRHVAREWPDTRVVMLSLQASEAYVAEALRSGAVAYVLKDSEPEDLYTAVRRAAAGKRFLCAGLSERAIEAFAQGKSAAQDPLLDLSEREQQALHLAVEGATNAQIAELLFISRRTAEKHRARAMRKLGLRSQQDLLRFAFSYGLLPAPTEGEPGKIER